MSRCSDWHLDIIQKKGGKNREWFANDGPSSLTKPSPWVALHLQRGGGGAREILAKAQGLCVPDAVHKLQ